VPRKTTSKKFSIEAAISAGNTWKPFAKPTISSKHFFTKPSINHQRTSYMQAQG